MLRVHSGVHDEEDLQCDKGSIEVCRSIDSNSNKDHGNKHNKCF